MRTLDEPIGKEQFVALLRLSLAKDRQGNGLVLGQSTKISSQAGGGSDNGYSVLDPASAIHHAIRFNRNTHRAACEGPERVDAALSICRQGGAGKFRKTFNYGIDAAILPFIKAGFGPKVRVGQFNRSDLLFRARDNGRSIVGW